MAIQTTFGACLDAEVALAQLATTAWPAPTAYHVAQLLRQVRDRTRAFEDQRSAIVTDLGAPRPPTDAEQARGILDDVIEVRPDKMRDYFAQYTELRARPTTIDGAPLQLAELEPQAVTALTLIDLGPFLANGQPTT